MSEDKVTLEIRHQIFVRPDGSHYVRETFGSQPPVYFDVADRAAAAALAASRLDLLMRMVADISPEAAEAVSEARIIDNLKVGNA